MAEICNCGDGVTVFGQPSCVPSFGRDSRIIFVQYLDNLGAVNSIKSTDVLDATFFEGKINAGVSPSVLDQSLRWNITETINNVIGERGENVTQDIDGIPLNVKQGVRNYDGTFYGAIANPTYVGALESMACSQMGYFIIDVNGNIIGMKNDTTGDLDPIKVQRNTLQVMYKFPTSTEVQNINIKFSVEENERDADLNYTPVTAVDTLALRSLIAVNGVTSNTALTGADLTMSLDYGTVFNGIAYEGAVIGDFTAYNVTQSSSIVITSVTETSAGVYAILIPAVLTTEVVKVDYAKVGFVMESVTFTAP